LLFRYVDVAVTLCLILLHGKDAIIFLMLPNVFTKILKIIFSRPAGYPETLYSSGFQKTV